MQVEIITPMGDALGRAYRLNHRYEMPTEDAKRLIDAGFAKPVATDASLVVDLLTKYGGGLLVTKTTDQALIVAAKAARLPVKRQHGFMRASDGNDGI